MKKLIALVLTLAVLGPATAQLRLPDPSTALASPGVEKMAGILFSRRFESGFGGARPNVLPPDAPESKLVQKVTDRLAAAVAMDRPNIVFQAKVVEDPSINAFCIPGGYIYVFTGLLTHLEEKHPGEVEEALAAIMGHEIAHAVLRHSLKSWAESEDFEAVLKDRAVFQQVLLASSRAQEFEADRYGALYALRAGYPLSSAVQVFERFPGSRSLYSSGAETHPSGEERVQALNKYREQVEGMVALWDEALKAASTRQFNNAVVALEILEAEFPNLPSVHNNIGWVYFQMYEDTRPKKPEQQLAYSYVSNLGLRVRGAAVEGDLLTLREAERAFQTALSLSPDMVEAAEGAAACALEQGNFEAAAALLQPLLADNPQRASLHNLLAVVRERQGQVEQAAALYQQAGDFAPAVYNLALLESKRQHADQAQKLFARYLELDGSGYWADQARRHMGAQPTAAAETTQPVREVAGIGLGASADQVQAALGAPTGSRALQSGTELRSYEGLEVALAGFGVSRITVSSPERGPVGPVAVGMAEAEVLEKLGTPAVRRSADGLTYWTYPSHGLALGLREGAVAEIVLGAR